jgi:hypothetical protein
VLHLVHIMKSPSPHFPQNVAPPRFSNWHFGHFIFYNPHAWIYQRFLGCLIGAQSKWISQ